MDKDINDRNSFWCEMDQTGINCFPQLSNEELDYTRTDFPPTVLDMIKIQDMQKEIETAKKKFEPVQMQTHVEN